MKKIPLTQGKFALIDDEDEELVSRHKWHTQSRGYVRTFVGRKSIYLHRLIMNAPDGVEVDHINNNKLDCRKSNMRLCTRSQNNMNKPCGKGSSLFKGVHWDKARGKWMARAVVKGKLKNLGRFEKEEDAARAYNRAAIENYGEFANLNEV